MKPTKEAVTNHPKVASYLNIPDLVVRGIPELGRDDRDYSLIHLAIIADIVREGRGDSFRFLEVDTQHAEGLAAVSFHLVRLESEEYHGGVSEDVQLRCKRNCDEFRISRETLWWHCLDTAADFRAYYSNPSRSQLAPFDLIFCKSPAPDLLDMTDMLRPGGVLAIGDYWDTEKTAMTERVDEVDFQGHDVNLNIVGPLVDMFTSTDEEGITRKGSRGTLFVIQKSVE